MKRKELLMHAIYEYGIPAQLDQAVEEAAELIQAINKLKRTSSLITLPTHRPTKSTSNKRAFAYYNLCSEIADMRVMLNQLELMMNKEAIDLAEDRKLSRLASRLGLKDPQPFYYARPIGHINQPNHPDYSAKTHGIEEGRKAAVRQINTYKQLRSKLQE